MARFQGKLWTNKQTVKPGVLDGLHWTVRLSVNFFKLPPQSYIKMADWCAKNETHELPLPPNRRFWKSTADIFRGVGSDISQFALERPGDSPTPRWNISRYLATATRGLTKNTKNFQAPLRLLSHHIVSDPLEYWPLPLVFWSGHIILLTGFH